MAINVTVFSCGGNVGIQADPDLVEGPREIREGAKAGLDRLLAASGWVEPAVPPGGRSAGNTE